jgi:hypothetical protein
MMPRHRLAMAGSPMAGVMMAGIAMLAGCSTPKAVEGPVGLGQIAYVGGPRVKPERVIEDSRCPAGTTCVWAGRVVLRATVYGGAWSKPVDLVLGVPVAIADGTLTLVAVTPPRLAGRSARTDATQSRFAFAFQGGY